MFGCVSIALRYKRVANQAKRRKTSTKPDANVHFNARLREGVLIVTTALSVFLLLALFTFHASDPSWSKLSADETISNSGGRVGAMVADALFYLFGYIAYIFPVLTCYAAWLYYRGRHQDQSDYDFYLLGLRSAGFIFIMASSCALASLHFLALHLPISAGGLFGNLIGFSMVDVFSTMGTTLILLAVLCCGITLYTGLSWLNVCEVVGRFSLIITAYSYRLVQSIPWANLIPKRRIADDEVEPASQRPLKRGEPLFKPGENLPPEIKRSAPVVTKPKPIQPSERSQKERQKSLFEPALKGSMPPLDLLDDVDKKTSSGGGYSNQELEEMSRNVELRLQDFNIDAKVTAVHPGPVVTRFELQLAAGTKVSKISALSKDLARSLSVISVRIVEVIPGKSVIGLETPNDIREMVQLREILSSQQYEKSRSPLSMALGKDVAGHPVIADLGKMPHLLVAGTTGSGKSVGVNGMILSMLYKSPPEKLRMIMIDPKMLELSVYDGIPHLLTPVVTDMKDASNALRWCVAEMDRRYQLMASMGVRNIAGYNSKVEEAKKRGAPLLDPLWLVEMGGEPDELAELPYIVVIADEFADMIMVVGKKIEELIARIAQKARAAGIHLILATQRPSVDVITGLIKANIPTRIAYQVSSRIDSRTILDQQGAEQLLGHGDMLYLPPGTSVPVRVHGAFVSDDEVHRVVKDWKRRAAPEYINEILEGGAAGEGLLPGETEDGDAEQDALYDQAVQIVIETRRASISNIQRRLKIGYNRAARIVEAMEAAGVVSPMENSGSREVLVPEGG